MTKIMLIVLVSFIAWMLFFDDNSFLTHREINKEIHKIEKENDFYSSEIKKDSTIIGNLKNKDSLEKFAREKYFMKKENEEIFIIEYDSVKKKE